MLVILLHFWGDVMLSKQTTMLNARGWGPKIFDEESTSFPGVCIQVEMQLGSGTSSAKDR